METEIKKLLDSIAELREKADVNAAFGEPVKVEERTVIPVATVTCCFKIGLGHRPSSREDEETTEAGEQRVAADVGAGGGGGLMARPLAVIEVTPAGTFVEPIVDEQKLALAGVLLTGWSVFWLARTLTKIFGRPD
ncbi:MAG: hypothetical protein DRI48_01910 [Chloroflexi bacterium]|nr:MAG: hypothetical protein DRI48_01910 [Chloroflexota bacterium]